MQYPKNTPKYPNISPTMYFYILKDFKITLANGLLFLFAYFFIDFYKVYDEYTSKYMKLGTKY